MQLYLDGDRLFELAREHREAYRTAEPFPHIVLDDVLPDAMLDVVLDAFPDPSSRVWKEYENYYEGKLETQGEERLGADVSLVLYQFNSAPFLRFLQELTGVTGLISDPYFSGGGLHQIERGGRLGVHADFSRHPVLPLHRRLNALVYLNRDWKDEYGGHLELWDRDMTECRARIAPVFNRMVVFSTTDWTFHGHPDPLTCPPGMTRKSIALYYFSVDRPRGETKRGKESTLFVPRPGEVLPQGTDGARGAGSDGLKEDRWSPGPVGAGARFRPSRRARLLAGAKRVTPPILYDAVADLRDRRGPSPR